MIVAGLIPALELFNTPGELISTPCGVTLLIKLGLAGIFLLVAAGNRFVPVPRVPAGPDPAAWRGRSGWR